MISSRCDIAIIALGTNIVFVLLMISLVGLGHFETLAQGTMLQQAQPMLLAELMLLVQVEIELTMSTA
jgi:hypothetical protein